MANAGGDVRQTPSQTTSLYLYVVQLRTILRAQLGENLYAMYLFGSAGYDTYQPGISNVDVYVVIREPEADYHKLARAISHSSVPCPARNLEFVLFTKASAAEQRRDLQIEMNFSTGRGVDDHIDLNPGSEPTSSYLVEITLGRLCSRICCGPFPSLVFARPKEEWVYDAILDLIDQSHLHGPILCNDVLNACRALRLVNTKVWGSKMAGGEWFLMGRRMGLLRNAESALVANAMIQ